MAVCLEVVKLKLKLLGNTNKHLFIYTQYLQIFAPHAASWGPIPDRDPVQRDEGYIS